MKTNHWKAALCAALLFPSSAALAQAPQAAVKELPTAARPENKDDAAALAQKLTNPVADLISVPFHRLAFRGLQSKGQQTSPDGMPWSQAPPTSRKVLAEVSPG